MTPIAHVNILVFLDSNFFFAGLVGGSYSTPLIEISWSHSIVRG